MVMSQWLVTVLAKTSDASAWYFSVSVLGDTERCEGCESRASTESDRARTTGDSSSSDGDCSVSATAAAAAPPRDRGGLRRPGLTTAHGLAKASRPLRPTVGDVKSAESSNSGASVSSARTAFV